MPYKSCAKAFDIKPYADFICTAEIYLAVTFVRFRRHTHTAKNSEKSGI